MYPRSTKLAVAPMLIEGVENTSSNINVYEQRLTTSI